MTGARDLNSPLISLQLCNPDGTLTAQGQAFMRRMWERTGYAPGVDAAWVATEADIGVLMSGLAESAGTQAMAQAQAALDEARMVLLDAQAIRAEARMALDEARDSAILSITARMPARDGTRS
ncbi:hypothetical protein AA12717_0270 [Gluconacetobacter sacchari DSM 12717]|uniref:Uncharacterized protein n=2 Tax=Gluconacetobacter sacchari TaxID=92759 RepID=A0A7W4IAN4_9PROT|nr:hypothetical protein [Gluconacetobacter sacchari]MBB2159355.1 hypothetical protein [Gluconacetobacter sacchari]GBQ19496.1 hypothetical protein AA12717_0270 [Gluconacetobacter sacchari DSM 12717]